MRYTNKSNEEWLKELNEHIEKHIKSKSFTTIDLASLMSLSQRQLYRRIKSLLETTPKEYIKQLRFARAYEYLQIEKYETIAETSRAVGFKDTVYFSKQFKKRYGVLPSEIYGKTLPNNDNQ